MRYAMVAFVLLALVFYAPLGWGISQLAAPRVIHVAAPPLAEGDVVWVSYFARRGSRSRVNQIVLYNLPDYQYQEGHALYEYQGDQIDRILAGPGDRVRWQDGRLWVNGVESALRPLRAEVVPARLSFTVPDDSVLILPSTVLLATAPVEAWNRLACVQASNIRGIVFFRSQPLWRVGRIR
jgi:hypothetical protein